MFFERNLPRHHIFWFFERISKFSFGGGDFVDVWREFFQELIERTHADFFQRLNEFRRRKCFIVGGQQRDKVELFIVEVLENNRLAGLPDDVHYGFCHKFCLLYRYNFGFNAVNQYPSIQFKNVHAD